LSDADWVSTLLIKPGNTLQKSLDGFAGNAKEVGF
jgi:hypothetical protein